MKKARKLAMISAMAVLLPAIGQPIFGQNAPSQFAPSQVDFGRALRPIPQALQGGHQGITTAPPSARPAPSPNYFRASTPAEAVPEPIPSRAPVARTDIPEPAISHGKRNSRATTHAASRPPAALPGCPTAAETGEKPKIGFPVSFEFGSAQLKPESLETLRNLGKALNQDLGDQKLFVIEGHTDAVGTLAYNEELSKLRAEAVKEFLVHEMGVSAERLEVTGRAYCEPINRQNPLGAENRRVVVINQSS